MKALVYHGPGEKSWIDRPDPKLQNPTDVIVRIDTTTICGTDLHILKGDVPAVTPGRILGHEGVGTIIEVGHAVTQLAVGDRVIISCISSCGHCSYCQQGIYAHCLADEGASGIGWIFGHLIDGTQAEYVRVPFAENSVYKVPEGVSDEAACCCPTSCRRASRSGSQYGQVKPGDVVAVIGAGPVGTRRDRDRRALRRRRRSSRSTSTTTGSSRRRSSGRRTLSTAGDADWKEQVMALTDGCGVDVAVEAVGVPATFADVPSSSSARGARGQRRGARQAGRAALQNLWIQNIAITMGLVNTNTTPMLLKLVAQRRLKVDNSHPPLRASRHDGRLRHVRPGRGDQSTEGDHRPQRANPERRRRFGSA